MSQESLKPQSSEQAASSSEEFATTGEIEWVAEMFKSRRVLPLKFLTTEHGFRDEVAKILVEEAMDLDELKDALRQIGEVTGSKKTYTDEEIIAFIEGIQRDIEKVDFFLPQITDTYGIRTKVRKLLVQAGVYAETGK